MADSGLFGLPLDVLTYRYLRMAHGDAVADAYGTVTMAPSTLNAARNPGSNATLESKVADMQAILDAGPYLDYVNIHHYEVDDPNIADASAVTTVTPGVIHALQEFLQVTTGCTMISNETSIRYNSQPALVTSLLQDYVDNHVPYVFWFDNADGNMYGDSPLNDSTAPFALRPNGVAFHDFVVNYP